MKRVVLNAAATFSFLLLSLLIVAWVVSYRLGAQWFFEAIAAPASDAMPLPGKPDTWQYQSHLALGNGEVQLVRRNIAFSDDVPPGWRRSNVPSEALTHLKPGGQTGGRGWRVGGIEYYHSDRKYVSTPPVRYWIWGFRVIGLRLWLPAVAAALPPAFWLAHRLRRRPPPGLCRRCGYNLTGNVSGNCPECGDPIVRVVPRQVAVP